MKAATAKSKVEFSTILFATDFSAAAARAIPYAKMIAKHYDASMVALHVASPMVSPMVQPAAWPAVLEAEKAQQEERRQSLRDEFAGIPTQALVEEGDILSNLNSAIHQNHVDLVVIGTHGRTGLGKFVLGSVAEEIFRTVTCPVLTVGPHAGGVKGAQFREILFAADLSPESQVAAAHAVSLAQEFQSRLIMLHVIEDPKPGDLVSEADLTASSENLLRKYLPEGAELWCKPEYIVAHGDKAKMILEIARQRESDLIVLGVRPESGVPGSSTHLPIATAHKVVTHAHCPVLTVRH